MTRPDRIPMSSGLRDPEYHAQPLTAEEEAKFRESVRLIGNDADTYGNWWSNHAAMRLLATLDIARADPEYHAQSRPEDAVTSVTALVTASDEDLEDAAPGGPDDQVRKALGDAIRNVTFPEHVGLANAYMLGWRPDPLRAPDTEYHAQPRPEDVDEAQVPTGQYGRRSTDWTRQRFDPDIHDGVSAAPLGADGDASGGPLVDLSRRPSSVDMSGPPDDYPEPPPTSAAVILYIAAALGAVAFVGVLAAVVMWMTS